MLQNSASQPITKMVTVGCGDVVEKRLIKAQMRLGSRGNLRQLAYLDVKPDCPLVIGDGNPIPIPWQYFPIGEDSLLPLHKLADAGLLGKDVLYYIATPAYCHLWYAKQLAHTDCRIAVEKPLTKSIPELVELGYYDDGNIHPVGHQLFKWPMLVATRSCTAERLRRARSVHFELMETKGIAHREIDDAVFDLGWHGFECVLAMYRAASVNVTIRPRQVRTATYLPLADEPTPKQFTAALIEADIETNHGTLPLTIRVGKGLAAGAKRLEFLDALGLPVLNVVLDESGPRAHYRMLRELLTAAEPDLRLSLRDNIGIAMACANAVAISANSCIYPFGTTPPFLRDVSHREGMSADAISAVQAPLGV